jgi:hypothetical protein
MMCVTFTIAVARVLQYGAATSSPVTFVFPWKCRASREAEFERQ